MKLRTEVEIPSFDFKFEFDSRIFTIGSCFSDVIGNYLSEAKFKVLANPFGNVYNLASIYKLIHTSIEQQQFSRSHVVCRDDAFFHLDFHSEIWGSSEEDLLRKIELERNRVHNFLKSANLLVITLGTSWVYYYEDEIISNCQKLPAARFKKQLLDFSEQKMLLHKLVNEVQAFNPKIKLIFTVSPVRHTKDGLVNNSLSKAILRLICHEITQEFSDTFYFPSYELMVDDLRDYRFYKSDLIHPSEVAENYIWELFSTELFSQDTLRVIADWKKIKMALRHRAFSPHARSYQVFLINLSENIKRFEPYFDISDEIAEVEALINQTKTIF